jgi:AraC-like DNA-binding protein
MLDGARAAQAMASATWVRDVRNFMATPGEKGENSQTKVCGARRHSGYRFVHFCYPNVHAMPALPTEPIDRLSAMLERLRVSARLFQSGALCGVHHFDVQPGRGFLHVLRKGTLTVAQRGADGRLYHTAVNEPTLLFYPMPLAHQFQNTTTEGAECTCATVEFEGGANHPLVRALPPLLCVPLRAVEGLNGALELLFAEADRVRCGHRLLADRLFEVVLIQLLRWLLDHPQQGAVWNLEKMAQHAGLSRSAFALRFKNLVGATPADYLADWRMALAMQQLVQGQSVKCIADSLGYGNASALSRVFAQRLGAPPRAWLAAARQASP